MQGNPIDSAQKSARPIRDELIANIRQSKEKLKFDLDMLATCALLFFTLDNILIDSISSAFPKTLVSYLFSCHLIDAIGGCAFCAYVNALFDLVKPEKRLESPVSIFLLIFLSGLFWEYIAPAFVPGSTADVLDIAAYLLGAALYIALLRCTLRRRPN